MTLGILVNTYNDASLLRRALRDLSANIMEEYRLVVDDDGSNASQEKQVRDIVQKYNGIMLRAPQKKGRAGSIAREMELFTILLKMDVNRILKIDPDTTVYDRSAFQGPSDADLYGARKRIDKNSLAHRHIMEVLAMIGAPLPNVDAYCQGGFYMLKCDLVEEIVESDSWKKYESIHRQLAFEVFEDRMLSLMAYSLGARIEFWDNGFFHGAKGRLEYQARLLTARYPAAAPLLIPVVRRMTLRRRQENR